MQKSRLLKRTEQAERFVEQFLSLPLIPEFVFRSPQIVKTTQKEVADLLIVHEGRSILISQKCQEDPSIRDRAKTISWVGKSTTEAVTQLRGALRTVESKKPAWCLHPRRGRVEFRHGLPKIDHAFAIIEAFERVELEADDTKFPLELKGTPITYYGTIQSLRGKDEGFVYGAAYLDAQPDWVFVFGSAKKVDRSDLMKRAMMLTRAAMAQYRKRNCMLVIDRDGVSYEVAVGKATSDFSNEERAAGREFFGHLKISDRYALCRKHPPSSRLSKSRVSARLASRWTDC